MKVFNLFACITLLIVIFASFALFNRLPDNIPIHWDIEGDANSFVTKDIGIFIVPIVLILFILVMNVSKQYLFSSKEFKKAYRKNSRQFYIYSTRKNIKKHGKLW